MIFGKRRLHSLILLLAISSSAGNSYSESAVSSYTLQNITITGTPLQQKRFLSWLNRIADIPKGQQTLLNIINTPHQLTITHSPAARLSAGRTIAPMTNDLINGVGADIVIIFDASIPEEGTQTVFNSQRNLIEFTAIQNLYHELAHAMHKIQGTWRYFDSEGQAIEEENIFRVQMSLYSNTPNYQRYGQNGVAIGSLEEQKIVGYQIKR